MQYKLSQSEYPYTHGLEQESLVSTSEALSNYLPLLHRNYYSKV